MNVYSGANSRGTGPDNRIFGHANDITKGHNILHQLSKYQVLNGEGVSYLGVAI